MGPGGDGFYGYKAERIKQIAPEDRNTNRGLLKQNVV